MSRPLDDAISVFESAFAAAPERTVLVQLPSWNIVAINRAAFAAAASFQSDPIGADVWSLLGEPSGGAIGRLGARPESWPEGEPAAHLWTSRREPLRVHQVVLWGMVGFAGEYVVAVSRDPDPADLGVLLSEAVNSSGMLGSLTEREFQVVNLLLRGMRVTSIGDVLFISHHTVRNHLRRIFDKLGVNSQVELIEKLRGR